jgi:hypothetical protein
VDLPVTDLLLPNGGGAWGLEGSVNFRGGSRVVDDFQGQPALKVVHQQNSGAGRDGDNDGGVAFNASPDDFFPAKWAKLSFDVFFEEDWKKDGYFVGRDRSKANKTLGWAKGGKFGGFMIGHGSASGKQHSKTGSSHRVMWQKGGGAISYIYPPIPPGRIREDGTMDEWQVHRELDFKIGQAGNDFFKESFPEGTLKVGQWNNIRIGTSLNTFTNSEANPDGEAWLRVNDVRRELKQIKWRRQPHLMINKIVWNVFFGGPEPAPFEVVAFYRNFKLETVHA